MTRVIGWILAIFIILLVIAALIKPDIDPFGGCNVHPGQCGRSQ